MNVGLWNNNIMQHGNQLNNQLASLNKKSSEKKSNTENAKKSNNNYDSVSKSIYKKPNQVGKAPVELSEKAQKLLDELKKKYSNMDFFVASYDTEEEAQRYLRQGKKEFSVLIDPELLEEMANDEETMKKYEDVLANAGGSLDELKENLGEDIDKVKSFGISIDKNGIVSYFVELDKITARQKEHNEKVMKEKDEAKQADKSKKAKENNDDKYNDKHKSTIISAGSIEELLDKIRKSYEDNKNYTSFDVSL